MVYAEFHEQGDVEKLLGWKPIPLFDRDNYPELASMQVRSNCTVCTRVPQFLRQYYLGFYSVKYWYDPVVKVWNDARMYDSCRK